MRQVMFIPLLACICNVSYSQEMTGDMGPPDDYFETMRSRSQIYGVRGIIRSDPVFPVSMDWRDHGVVTPAKSQGKLGSCWAFAAVGVIESRWAMLGNKLTRFSEQQLVNCAHFTMRHNVRALRFYESHEPMPEKCAPYKGYQYSCDSLACPPKDYYAWGYYTVNTSSVLDIKTSLYVDGPAYLGYRVFDDFLDFWDNGSPGEVYMNDPGSLRTGGHAVLLIGWDDEKRAWLVKNSWGQSGPEGDGTFWISWDQHYNSMNFWVASVASYSDPDSGEDVFSCAITKSARRKKSGSSVHRVAWELFSR